MNPFFTWMGGKRCLCAIILSLFPAHFDRYIEVFGGGGAVLFAKKKTKFEVYNDYNGNLTNLFNVVKLKVVLFVKELNFLPINSRVDFEALVNHLNHDIYGEEHYKEELEVCEQVLTPPQFEEIRRIYETRSENLDVSRAVAFLKLIKYSYGSGCKSYSCQPYNIRKAFQDIERASRRLADVVIENKDFQDLIEQYDRETALFYLDPPYYFTEKIYKDTNFTRETHVRLRDTLLKVKGKFILSYNDCEEIRELYSDEKFFIIPVERMNNLGQRYESGAVFKEVLILNYNPDEESTQLKLAM